MMSRGLGLCFKLFSSQAAEPFHIYPKEFIKVYSHPVTPLAAALNKLKTVYTTITLGVSPMSVALHHFDLITYESLVTAISGSCVTTGTILGLSYLSTGLVGAAYLTRNMKETKISYLDSKGKRRDIEMPIEDLKVMSVSKRNVFFYSLNQVPHAEMRLKLYLKLGEVYNTEGFVTVFKMFP